MNPPLCAMQVYGGTPETPPEFCDEEVVLGEEYCPAHLQDAWGDDERYDRWRDQMMEDLV
jgi:hypothetical protein